MAKGGSSNHFDQPPTHSPPPPPPPLNKREKRKLAFEERFNGIGQAFARNRNNHFVIQNQSLQASLTYINQQDSYSDRPINDWPAHIKDNVDTILSNNPRMKGHLEASPRAAHFAASYAEEINAAMEARDAQLAAVVVSTEYPQKDCNRGLILLQEAHNAKIDELQKDFDYFTRVAMEEHVQLINSVRERLIASVSRRRAKLTSGRDQLDALDTNTLVSNQTSYSMQHPTSPGAPQSNRKTRHTRHRLEVDEMGLIGDKRKRKIAGDIDNESPSRAANDDSLDISKQESFLDERPVVSMSHLFTDRDRALILSTAQKQIVQEISRDRRRAARKAVNEDLSENDSNDESSSEDDPDIQSGIASPPNGHLDMENSNLLAPAMDRTANSSHHATRSSKFTLNGTTAQRNPHGDLVGRSSAPKLSAVQRERKKEDDYQRAPPLNVAEAEQDLLLMRQSIREGDGGMSSFVPAACPEIQNYVLEPSAIS